MRVGYTVRKTGLMLIKGSTGSTGPTGRYAGPYYGLYIRALQPLRARTGTTGPRALMQREGPDPKIQQAFVDLGCPCNSRNEGPNLGRALATTRAMPPLLKVSWELIVPQDLVSTVHPCTNGWSQGRAVRVPRSGLSACCHSLKPLGIQQLRARKPMLLSIFRGSSFTTKVSLFSNCHSKSGADSPPAPCGSTLSTSSSL